MATLNWLLNSLPKASVILIKRMGSTTKDSKPIGFADICGNWVTENGTEFQIFSGGGKCFITFHKTYKWGKKIGKIKHFIHHVNNGEFYFTMDKMMYELWYSRADNTIRLKPVTYCTKKEYEFKITSL